MKRIFAVMLLAVGLVAFDDMVSEAEGAGPRLVADYNDVIGPAKTTITVFQSSGSFVSIPSTATYRICLTNLDASPTVTQTFANYQVNLLSQGTTTYSVAVASGAVISKVWPETNPWCAERNQSVVITGNTSSTFGPGITLNISYQGFTQQK